MEKIRTQVEKELKLQEAIDEQHEKLYPKLKKAMDIQNLKKAVTDDLMVSPEHNWRTPLDEELETLTSKVVNEGSAAD